VPKRTAVLGRGQGLEQVLAPALARELVSEPALEPGQAQVPERGSVMEQEPEPAGWRVVLTATGPTGCMK
jgi:hypothetical protein